MEFKGEQMEEWERKMVEEVGKGKGIDNGSLVKGMLYSAGLKK